MNRKPPPLYQFIVFDARAWTMDADDCTVLVACRSLSEARGYVKHEWPDARIQRVRRSGALNPQGGPIYNADKWED